jgi:hypothetical protein
LPISSLYRPQPYAEAFNQFEVGSIYPGNDRVNSHPCIFLLLSSLLAIFKLRLPLFNEGIHAFFLVFGGKK